MATTPHIDHIGEAHQPVAEHGHRVGLPRPGVAGQPPLAALPVGNLRRVLAEDHPLEAFLATLGRSCRSPSTRRAILKVGGRHLDPRLSERATDDLLQCAAISPRPGLNCGNGARLQPHVERLRPVVSL
jgi:hypothetical protein